MGDLPYEGMPGDLASRAVSLASEGLSNVAWSKEDALQVVQWALGAEIAILGGNVWIDRKGRLTASVDGWYCEVQAGESAEAFVARSCERAMAYVSSYPSRERQQTFYSMELADREGLLRLQGIGLRESARNLLIEYDERFASMNLRSNGPEIRDWRDRGLYHAELVIVLRQEGEAVAILSYPIFDSGVQVTSELDVRDSLRQDIEDFLAKA